MMRLAACLLPAALPLAASLAGCGGAKAPTQPTLDLAISAGTTQNPETDGSPAPVGIRLYQLAATGSFDRADVYALTGSEASVLGQDLLAGETILANPGQTLNIHRTLKPGAQFLGVAVLFRDIDHATWRATAPLAASGTTYLALATTTLSMTLAKSSKRRLGEIMRSPPSPSALPSLPSVPALPTMPSVSSVPSVPSVPSAPSVPTIPSLPSSPF